MLYVLLQAVHCQCFCIFFFFLFVRPFNCIIYQISPVLIFPAVTVRFVKIPRPRCLYKNLHLSRNRNLILTGNSLVVITEVCAGMLCSSACILNGKSTLTVCLLRHSHQKHAALLHSNLPCCWKHHIQAQSS